MGEVRKYGRFFSRLLYKEENTYLHKYVLHSVHARKYFTNKQYRVLQHVYCHSTYCRFTYSTDLSVRQRGLSAPQGRRNQVGGRGAFPPPNFGRLFKPILISGWEADYAHHSTTRPSGFSNLPTALLLDMGYHLYFRP